MRITRYLSFFLAFILAGCAGVTPPPQVSEAPVPSGPPRQLIIFIPQTDQGASSWFKLLEKYPTLKMAIAVSPRFQRFTKEPALKEKALELVKAGRLELALQIPNAPFLPLLINTDSAKAALPPNTPLPNPPFAHPEDVIQIVARAKNDFVKMWGMAPKGMVLPQGAVNADLLKLMNQRGFGWVVGALGAPSFDGAYRFGSLLVWDATPAKEPERFAIEVWDERQTSNPTQSLQILNTWAQNLTQKGRTPVLPGDPDLPVQDLPQDILWGNRSWTSKDWTPWIGSAPKNAAWSWLRTTRDALESFKNSGRASVRRLDMAFEEIFNAENANYFSGMTEGQTTFSLAEEREREFKATLSSVFRLMGQQPPDHLFSTPSDSHVGGFRVSSTTLHWETAPDGRGHLTIEDPAGDDKGDGQLAYPSGAKGTPGMYDLRKIEVWVSPETLDWVITPAALTGSILGNFETLGPLIDIYLDLNGQAGVGTVSLLPDRGAAVASADAWEYAFTLWGTHAQFYRTRGAETFELSETVPLTIENGQIKFSVPRSWLRGNPQRWGYQVLTMSYDQKSLDSSARPLISPEMTVAKRLPIYDLVDPLDIVQSDLLREIEEGKRSDIPFVRVPAHSR